jgi:NADH dehydrogenase FAD-containing subunit
MYRASYNLFEQLQAAFGYGGIKPPQKKQKPRVLVVGYGWGGKAFCDTIDRNKYNVNVVTATPYFLNTPKLVSNIEYGDNSSKIDRLRVQNLHFGRCVGIQPKVNSADFEVSSENLIQNSLEAAKLFGKFSLSYDYLVLAVGSVPNTYGIPGAETCTFLKTFDDMKKLQFKVKDVNNSAPIPINIIGAGPTGVELALTLAAQNKSVRLIEAAPQILTGFSDVTRQAVMKDLEAAKVDLCLKTGVTAVEKDYILATDKMFPTNLTVWTSGVKPNPLVKFVSDGGRPLTDGLFRIK